MLKLGFIGSGIIGSALAIQLNRKGYPVLAVSSRRSESSANLAGMVRGAYAVASNQAVADSADLVFITTPDDAIGAVAGDIDWRKGQMVVHCSGADSTAILKPAADAGAYVGVFHPLQTFAGIQQAIENTPGSTFALEAEEPLLSALKKMATTLGGYWIELRPEDKTAYHTAAVIVCNYLITLTKLAIDLWQTFGIPPSQAERALLPLIKGTVHNIETVGLPDCLTGPIARGDTGTIKKHIEALQKRAPDLLETYKELGLKTIPIAQAKGKIDVHQTKELEEILNAV